MSVTQLVCNKLHFCHIFHSFITASSYYHEGPYHSGGHCDVIAEEHQIPCGEGSRTDERECKVLGCCFDENTGCYLGKTCIVHVIYGTSIICFNKLLYLSK